MEIQNLSVIDLAKLFKGQDAVVTDGYFNKPVALVNDHVIRASIMTEPYFWHFHPDSDESFIVIEGSIFIDLEDKTIELFPNQIITIPKNVVHRTRPNGSRSVNITFESRTMTTERVSSGDGQN